MILKGNQRAGGRQMALHLLNGEQNEHVNVHEVSGFIASDVLGALNEAYALSKGTQCKQFMYSLSLNPPQNERVPIDTFEAALDRVEKKLGLEGQPRVVVFHEKEGRRHAHCVWSRIDIDKMTAINISHPKLKLNTIAKSLYLEHGWQMPDGFRDKKQKNPLNYTRAEWQQALRIGRKPTDIKRELQGCWAISDSKQSFSNALQEQGYYLARGDKRGYVAVDLHGEVYSLTRQLGQKKDLLAARLGKLDTLPSVAEVKTNIHGRLSKLFKGYADELVLQHTQQAKPLKNAKHEMIKEHRQSRSKLECTQKERWQAEELKRSAQIRKGFKGIWDKLNGRYWKTRKQNERETWQTYKRDQKEREELIHKQLIQRQNLQTQIKLLHDKQELERKELFRDLSQFNSNEQSKDKPSFEKEWFHGFEQDEWNQLEQEFDDDLDMDDPDIDIEPEI
ncbi:MAG: relaxase [gamma proteobacterium endosymbiont of Lamellibrachia anaximandri]|nr:relaxase [gamma proteobacterium endosymbiont of Lamellibrachia anaximandri]